MLRYLLQILMMKRMTMAYLILQVIMSLYMSKIWVVLMSYMKKKNHNAWKFPTLNTCNKKSDN